MPSFSRGFIRTWQWKLTICSGRLGKQSLYCLKGNPLLISWKEIKLYKNWNNCLKAFMLFETQFYMVRFSSNSHITLQIAIEFRLSQGGKYKAQCFCWIYLSSKSVWICWPWHSLLNPRVSVRPSYTRTIQQFKVSFSRLKHLCTWLKWELLKAYCHLLKTVTR